MLMGWRTPWLVESYRAEAEEEEEAGCYRDSNDLLDSIMQYKKDS